jgi:mono/diheme cytochrome c family protein
MTRFAGLLLAACLAAVAQSPEGAKIFRQSCAVGYCHGSAGTAGRAPALVDRRFPADHVLKVVRDGMPATGMPGWKDRLSAGELNAVVAYVVHVSGGTGQAMAGATASASIPAAAKRGRDLFFDPVRATRCATCHALEGKGTAVGPNLAAGAPNVQLIRTGKPAAVRQARAGSDAFPALLVEQKDDWTRVYDLTVAPPVLRTLAKSDLTWSSGASWKHSTAVASYSDADLQAIAGYLQWLSTR